jgi:hypothetical protein
LGSERKRQDHREQAGNAGAGNHNPANNLVRNGRKA